MKTIQHDPLTCTGCGEQMDCSMNTAGDEEPTPGDVTVCILCREPMRYGPTLALEPLDLATVPPDVRQRIETVQRAIAASAPS